MKRSQLNHLHNFMLKATVVAQRIEGSGNGMKAVLFLPVGPNTLIQ